MLTRGRRHRRVRSFAACSTASPCLGDFVVKGGLRKRTLIQASLERIPLLGLDHAASSVGGRSCPSRRRSVGISARKSSRTHASKRVNAGQACLTKRRPAQLARKARPSGRREASRTAVPRIEPVCRGGDSHSRTFAFISGKKVLRFPRRASNASARIPKRDRSDRPNTDPSHRPGQSIHPLRYS